MSVGGHSGKLHDLPAMKLPHLAFLVVYSLLFEDCSEDSLTILIDDGS
jgi:hypothetical protein